jgi:hypothetical protein
MSSRGRGSARGDTDHGREGEAECADDWDDHDYYGDDWAEAMVVGVTAAIRRPLADPL